MKTFHQPYPLQSHINSLKNQEKTIGFVPTMGALHQGHISLIKQALDQTDITIVSIFVNPTQFSKNEDLDKYPKPINKDKDILKKLGVDILFSPEPNTIYKRADSTQVFVPKLSKILCGKHRPTHFNGVCMVVLRLLNITRPTYMYLGEKDFQQLRLIELMIADLFLSTKIVPCPIIRESDGLALSSRNIYLNQKERKTAASIYQMLTHAKQCVNNGDNNVKNIINKIKTTLHPSIKIDYIEIIDAETLKKQQAINSKSRLLFAGFIGKTRLIDNIKL